MRGIYIADWCCEWGISTNNIYKDTVNDVYVQIYVAWQQPQFPQQKDTLGIYILFGL